MSLKIKLYHAIAPNKLVSGPRAATAFVLPDLVSGSVLSVEYQALLGNVGTFYEIMEVAAYAGPQIILQAGDGTQLAYQNVFTPDGSQNIYTGSLSLQDAAFTNAVSTLLPTGVNSSGAQIFGYISIKTTDTLGNPVVLPSTPVRLWKNPFTAPTPTVPPGEVAATQPWAQNSFINRNGDGTPWIVKSLDKTTTWLRWYDNDGIEQKKQL